MQEKTIKARQKKMGENRSKDADKTETTAKRENKVRRDQTGVERRRNSRRQMFSVKNLVNLSHSSLLLPLLLQSQKGETLILGERR